MNLHDSLWECIVLNEEQETINSEQLQSTLRILMDPVKMTVDETIKILYPIIYDFEAEYQVNVKMPSDKHNLEKLIRVIDLFRRMQLYHKPDKSQKKESIIEQIKQKKKINSQNQRLEKYKELTFKPKIDPKSARIDSEIIEKIVNANSTQHISQALFGEDSQDSAKKIDRVQLMLHKKAKQNELLAEKQRLREQDDLKDCTFIPSINVSNEESNYSTREQSFIQRLYPQEQIQNKRQFIEEMDEQRQQMLLEQELEKCTFQPQINDGISYDPQTEAPKDYERTVGRLRYANEQNKKKKDMLDYVPCGEGYERLKNMPFNPPSMTNRQTKQKQKPLLVMDVNIAPGKSGRLTLYPEDNPAIVARNFAKIFSLNSQMEETILLVLIEQKNQFLKKQK